MDQQVTVRAQCRKCGKTHTATVRRQWWESASLRCCGFTDTPWLTANGEVRHNGVFRPMQGFMNQQVTAGEKITVRGPVTAGEKLVVDVRGSVHLKP